MYTKSENFLQTFKIEVKNQLKSSQRCRELLQQLFIVLGKKRWMLIASTKLVASPWAGLTKQIYK